MIKSDLKKFELEIVFKGKTNPKLFYRYVNSKLLVTNQINQIMDTKGNHITDPEMLNALVRAKWFCSQGLIDLSSQTGAFNIRDENNNVFMNKIRLLRLLLHGFDGISSVWNKPKF
ncbi:hypothetical protein BpHYR1_029494 [Brachionus plicatilis]|uniref:Uncharacterized protein n=1 Tax=Brachionus plicatilis TaxID=10195 RepID=A0A3M7RYE2_BRAPC|nr:hypothetical protein BpHYR1_029494 [Brachionus plicatilis]